MTTIGRGDYEALGRINVGDAQIPSDHVVRLEMRGLVKNDASGLRLTEAGRRQLRNAPTFETAVNPERNSGRDALGRRLGRRSPNNGRYSPF
jgi:hypothetical protein